MKHVPATINSMVRVRLRDSGLEALRRDHESLGDEALAVLGPWRTPEVDAEGRAEFVMWDLMRVFGPLMRHGGEAPFENDFSIDPAERRDGSEST